MRITSRLVLATGLTTFLAASAAAQTPPQSPPPTPTPTEQQPPVTPTPAQETPQTPPAQTPPPPTPEQTPAPARPRVKNPRWTISGNFGYQLINSEFASSTEFEAFDETATLTSAGELTSAPIFDGGIAYQLGESVGFGAAFSYYTSKSDVQVLARIPHPIFFDQVRTATYEATDIKNSSGALHLNGIWFVPFTTEIDFQISAGPSIVFVNQEVVTAANLLSENPPFTDPRIDSITVTAEKKTTVGFNAAVDMAYMANDQYGFGVTARYLFASADVEGLTDSLQVGGFQIGGGVRIRF